MDAILAFEDDVGRLEAIDDDGGSADVVFELRAEATALNALLALPFTAGGNEAESCCGQSIAEGAALFLTYVDDGKAGGWIVLKVGTGGPPR